MNRRVRYIAPSLLLLVAACALLVDAARSRAQTEPPLEHHVFMPSALRDVGLDALPGPATALPTDPSSATPQPSETPIASETPPPSATPTASPTESPSPIPTKVPGRIRGQILVEGSPIEAGFGTAPFLPQIELQRKLAGMEGWETVGTAETDDNGEFEFDSVTPIENGEVYRVRWENPPDLGLFEWLYRWTTGEITSLAPDEVVTLDPIEVADLELASPQSSWWNTLPLTFSWRQRSQRDDSYRWGVATCEDTDRDQHDRGYLTRPLGYERRYELEALPPGIRYDTMYCWFVSIETDSGGSGVSNDARRITFCSDPNRNCPP